MKQYTNELTAGHELDEIVNFREIFHFDAISCIVWRQSRGSFRTQRVINFDQSRKSVCLEDATSSISLMDLSLIRFIKRMIGRPAIKSVNLILLHFYIIIKVK